MIATGPMGDFSGTQMNSPGRRLTTSLAASEINLKSGDAHDGGGRRSSQNRAAVENEFHRNFPVYVFSTIMILPLLGDIPPPAMVKKSEEGPLLGVQSSRAAMVAVLLLSGMSTAIAEDNIRTERVHFDPGTNGATVKGKVKGYDAVDYVLEASKGQHMSVSMNTDNASSYFNILAPGESEVAMFIGSTSGNEYKGKLPKSGNYKIRVYLMRNAARRDEVAKYTIKMKITGDAEKAGASPDKPNHKHVELGDLKGMNAIAAIDVMTARGFKGVDTITSGETLYGIYYNSSTKQCIQLTNADDKVYAVNDIKTHPKCH